jgi:serine/threonine protein phosphatase PrpC
MAELLARKALENGSTDNITAIFVLLKDDLSQIEKPIIL